MADGDDAAEASAHRNNGAYIDGDGYYLGLTRMPQVDPVWTDQMFPDGGRRLSLVHYLFRSSMVLGKDRSEDVWRKFKEFSLFCMGAAIPFTAASLASPDVNLPAPYWATKFHHDILPLLSNYEDVESIRLIATLDPRLHARSYPDRREIHVSELTRVHLRTINLAVWSYVYRLGDSDIDWEQIDDVNILVDVLPFLLALRGDIDHSGLGIPRAWSADALWAALCTTRIQMTFMIAHEYAHLLLHAGKHPAAELEVEADRFAYDLILRLPWSFATGDVWIAIRWFFWVAAIDRIVSELLYGGAVDWDQARIRDRERMLLPLIDKNCLDRYDNMYEFIGTYLLIRAKHHLLNAERNWIAQYATDFYLRYRWGAGWMESPTDRREHR